MRLIAVEEKDIKNLMEKLELEKLLVGLNLSSCESATAFSIDEVHRRFHYVVCSWVQEHGSNYPNE